MPYIDADYYTNTYKGMAVGDTTAFSRLEARASDVIDQLTSHKIAQSANKLEDFIPFIRDQVKKATAAQVENMFLQGGETAVHGGSPSSVSVGNFSYQEPNNNSSVVSQAVINHLRPTGLLYRGVSVNDC